VILFLLTAETVSAQYVFPLIAAGRQVDRISYESTLIVYSRSIGRRPCELRVTNITSPVILNKAGTVTRALAVSFTLAPYDWEVLRISSQDAIKTGYAVLDCGGLSTYFDVEAQMIYTYLDAAGNKLSETAVFKSEPIEWGAQIAVDQRRGERVAIAITNADTRTANIDITVEVTYNLPVGATFTVTVPPGQTVTKFVDELRNLSPAFLGRLRIKEASRVPFYIMALRFSGTVFATMPVSDCAVPSCVYP
jgi:hypothetical protein